uniref:acyl-CoA-binding domain-containing protein 5 isoform X2 n=1 Tax=Myxine glutinosa TaxID=7769 RepID=UPI00358F6133
MSFKSGGMADNNPLFQRRFEAAVQVVRSLPKNGSYQPSQELMLRFYGFYKQAVCGPCDVARPAFWDPPGRYKWNAWKAVGNMSKEEAMISYVEEIKKIIETMPVTEHVEKFLHQLGPFYELVDDVPKASSFLPHGLNDALASSEELGKMNGQLHGTSCSEDGHSDDDGEDEDEDEEGSTNFAVQEVPIKLSKENGLEMEEEARPLGFSKILCDTEQPEQKFGVMGTPNMDSGNGDESKHGSDDEGRSNRTNGPDFGQDVQVQAEHTTESGNLLDEDPRLTERVESGGEMVTGNGARTTQLLSDSDGEEFCDSMEHLASNEKQKAKALRKSHLNSIGAGKAQMFCKPGASKTHEIGDDCERQCGMEAGFAVGWGGEGPGTGGPGGGQRNGSRRGGERRGFHEERGPRREMVDDRRQGLGSGGNEGGSGDGRGGEDWRGHAAGRIDVGEQIALALVRLQQDMHSVLQRLNTLEALTTSQARTLQFPQHFEMRVPVQSESSVWPFNIPGRTLIFVLVWPFIAQWLIRVFLRRRRFQPNHHLSQHIVQSDCAPC